MSNRHSIRGQPINVKDWKLETFWIGAGGGPEQIDSVHVETLVASCEAEFDPDYDYEKKGFLIWHCGRRGNMLSLWHTGHWGGTREIFHYSHYWLHSEPDVVEVLTRADPVLSCYDIDTVVLILNEIREL